MKTNFFFLFPDGKKEERGEGGGASGRYLRKREFILNVDLLLKFQATVEFSFIPVYSRYCFHLYRNLVSVHKIGERREKGIRGQRSRLMPSPKFKKSAIQNKANTTRCLGMNPQVL